MNRNFSLNLGAGPSSMPSRSRQFRATSRASRSPYKERFPNELAAQYPVFARVNETLEVLYKIGSFPSHIDMTLVIKELFRSNIADLANKRNHMALKNMREALKESELLFKTAPDFRAHAEKDTKFPFVSAETLLAALCVEGGIPAAWEETVAWENFKFLLYEITDEKTPEFWKGQQFGNKGWMQQVFKPQPIQQAPVPGEIVKINVNGYFNGIPTDWTSVTAIGNPKYEFRCEILEPTQGTAKRRGRKPKSPNRPDPATPMIQEETSAIPSIEDQEVATPQHSPPREPSVTVDTVATRGSSGFGLPAESVILEFKANPDLHNWATKFTQSTDTELEENDPLLEGVLKVFERKEEGNVEFAMLLVAREHLQNQVIPSDNDHLKKIKAARENETAIHEQLMAPIKACKDTIATFTNREKGMESRMKKMEQFSELVNDELTKREGTRGHGAHPMTPGNTRSGAQYIAEDDDFDLGPAEIQREQEARDREILWEHLGNVTDKQAFIYKVMVPIWNKLSRNQWGDYETYREAIEKYVAQNAIPERTHERMYNIQYEARKDMNCFEIEREMPVFTVVDYQGKQDEYADTEK